MNNEMVIKFRGFDAIGERGWVYGDLWHNQRVTTSGLVPRVMVAGYEVQADTVGQFSGLHDKDGREIYVGDIVRWDHDHLLYTVVFQSGMFYASVSKCNVDIYGGFPLWYLCGAEGHCTVVGNRWDNPELLKENNQTIKQD